MATTTTNYGFDIPQSTDLVKDGATAIATLGQDIDTAMNTALGTKKAGMVLLNTTSFSAVSSQSINDVFSTTYDNYKVLININSSPTDALTLRLRVGGSDNSSNNYMWAGYTIESNTVFLSAMGSSGAVSSYRIGNTYGNTSTAELLIANPFKTQQTQFHSKNASYSTASNWAVDQVLSGTTTVTTSYTGFTILIASSTITGSVSVYGVNK
jgi:hypothetical protein